jgi:hypothetical protein
VRAADTSAAAIDEWTGERLGPAAAPEGVRPAGVAPVGNYAVQVCVGLVGNGAGCFEGHCLGLWVRVLGVGTSPQGRLAVSCTATLSNRC